MRFSHVNMRFFFPCWHEIFPCWHGKRNTLLYVDIQAFTRNMNGLWWSTQCRTVWQSGIRPRPPQRQSGIRPRPPQSLGHKRPPGPCPTSQGQTSPGACQTPQTLHLELTNSSLAILCAGPPVCALPPHQAALTCMSKSICNMHVGFCKMHVGICYIHVGFCNMTHQEKVLHVVMSTWDFFQNAMLGKNPMLTWGESSLSPPHIHTPIYISTHINSHVYP